MAAYSRSALPPTTDPAEPSTRETDSRLNWVSEMRALFSPRGVQNEDGSINQEFFKPRQIIIQIGTLRLV
jgi:hypothetical protein